MDSSMTAGSVLIAEIEFLTTSQVLKRNVLSINSQNWFLFFFILGVRHFWDAANGHSHATVHCGLISSHKLSQVLWLRSLRKWPDVTGSDSINSSDGALLSGFCASHYLVMGGVMTLFVWPLSSHWRPLHSSQGLGEVGYPTCLR